MRKSLQKDYESVIINIEKQIRLERRYLYD